MVGSFRAWIPVMILIVAWSPALVASPSEGTPQQALVEVVMATKAATVEKHLPESLLSVLRELSLADRAIAEQKMLVGPNLCEEGAELAVPDDGHALLVMRRKGSETGPEVRVIREITSGNESILELAVDRGGNFTQTVLIWMRLEDDEWRITQVDMPRFSERIAIDDSSFADRFRNISHKERQSRITSIIYTLQAAVQQIAAVQPDVGFPSDLSDLGPRADEGDDDDSGKPAALLPREMATNEFSQEGYIFHYELRRAGPQGDFTIIARPVDRGGVGTPSYFLDASGTVRSTEEDRDPTPEDDPVQ